MTDRLHMVSGARLKRWADDSEVTFVFLDDGVLQISAADEQAMDSYNSWVECTASLSPEQVRRLIAWLQVHGPPKSPEE